MPAAHVASRPSRPWSAVVGVVVFALVVIAGKLIVASPSWSASEMAWVSAVNSTSHAFLDAVAYTVNYLLGPIGAVIVAAVIVSVLWALSRNWRLALRLAVLIAASWGTAELTKSLVQRPRPDVDVLPHPSAVNPHTFSYPSGHTAFAVAIGLSVVLVFSPGLIRRALIGVSVVVVLITGWSRVYLGVHYPTDVLASMVLVPGVLIAVSFLLPNRTPFARYRRVASGAIADPRRGGDRRGPAPQRNDHAGC